MFPVLFQFGGITLHTYGALAAAGVLLALWVAQRQAPVRGLDSARVWNLGIYMVLAGIVGSKIWLLAEDWDYYREDFSRIFAVSTLQAAGVFYGGLLAALAVAYFYARRAGFGFLQLADVYAAPLALGHAIGRLGCFAAGCCWGQETQAAWAVRFSDPYAASLVGVPLEVGLHPVQLYESALNFLLFTILWRLSKSEAVSAPAGSIFAAYLMLYGCIRVTTEFFRGDPERTLLFGGAVSLMQAVSAVMIAAGLWIWMRRRQIRTT